MNDRLAWFKFIDAGVFFILLTLCVYHLLIYIGRWKSREERGNLYVSIFTGALAFFVFKNSYWFIQFHKGDIELFTYFFEAILFALMLFSCKMYLDNLLQRKTLKIYYSIVFAVTGLLLLLYLLPLRSLNCNYLYLYRFKDKVYLPTTLVFGGILLMVLIPYLVDIIKNRRFKDISILLALSGLGFILGYLIIRKVYVIKNLDTFYYHPLLAVGGFLLALSLSQRFNKEHRMLKKLRGDLESEVELRTEELRAARDELLRMNQKKTEMFINLAHETRTPLTLIRYHLEKYSEKRRLSPEMEVVKNNILKLQRDMVNFLDSEKLLRGEIIYDHDQKVDLSEFAREKARFFKPFIEENGLTFESGIDDDVHIDIDPFALERILNNLLMNAVKFTEEGSVTLSVRKGEDRVICSVTDTGRGMSQNQINRLFHPFTQISEKKENIQGYGMGLFITRSLVEEARGIIKVDSKEGKGTAFILELPLSDSNTSSIESSDIRSYFEAPTVISAKRLPENSEDETVAKPVILLVEDNQELLGVLAEELSTYYRIIAAVSGEDALKKLIYSPVPDLVVSDIMMDNGDGEMLLESLQKDKKYSAIPFIFLTALTEENVRLKAFRNGVIEYIQKPFSMEELKVRIASLVEFSRKKQNRLVQGAIDLLTNGLKKQDADPEKARMERFDNRCRELELSERQQEIAALISEGLEYKEIAGMLSISQRTVTRHVQNLYEKLQVHNKVELVNKLFSSSPSVESV